MNEYGEMFYGTLPPDTQDFRQVLAGIGRTIRERAAATGQRFVESAREARALQDQAFGNPTNPLRITDERALARLTDMIMGGPLGFAPAGITAYHGSPYLFRQFDPAKVGAGEGAQAYGVGAGYTAEARKVAEGYKEQLSNFEQPFIKFDGKKIAGQDLSDTDLEVFKLLERGKRDAGQFPHNTVYYAKKQAEASGNDAALKRLDELGRNVKFGYETNRGYLYKGDIPDEILPKFLDWDKPLSQQTQDIREVLKRRITDVVPTDKFDMGGNARLRDNRNGQIDKTSPNPWLMETTSESGTKFFGLSQKDVDRMFGRKDAKDLTGEQIYARLTQEMGSQQAASDYLNSIGIRGIRYLDQGSRGEGKGTSNFIPFRAEDYKIQEINDIPIEDWISKGLLGP